MDVTGKRWLAGAATASFFIEPASNANIALRCRNSFLEVSFLDLRNTDLQRALENYRRVDLLRYVLQIRTAGNRNSASRRLLLPKIETTQ